MRTPGALVTRAWRHMRALWPRWTLVPPLPFVAYLAYLATRGAVRVEHVLMVLLVLGLAYGNSTTKKLCVGAYPIGLVGLVYDAMGRLGTAGLAASDVHLCDLRAAELRWFGVQTAAGRVTLPDWFAAHGSPVADVVFAVPYATYIFATMGFAVYLYVKSYPSLRRFAWAFLLVNVAGFTTYHLYPAAPPWYFHAHGCDVDVATRPFQGAALERVDALLGVGYFAGMYSRSARVFGAMPSLHVTYPLLIALAGFRVLGWKGRCLALLFLVSMCCGAVYLDHHWVLDVVAGLVYGVIAFTIVSLVFQRLPSVTSARAPAPAEAT